MDSEIQPFLLIKSRSYSNTLLQTTFWIWCDYMNESNLQKDHLSLNNALALTLFNTTDQLIVNKDAEITTAH